MFLLFTNDIHGCEPDVLTVCTQGVTELSHFVIPPLEYHPNIGRHPRAKIIMQRPVPGRMTIPVLRTSISVTSCVNNNCSGVQIGIMDGTTLLVQYS